MNMKKALALMIVLFAKTAHTMNDMVRVTTNDQQKFEISKNTARYFRTLQDCSENVNACNDLSSDTGDDLANHAGPIVLSRISSNAWKKLMEQGMPWVMKLYQRADENESDTIERILKIDPIDRKSNAKKVLDKFDLPPYGSEIQNEVLATLHEFGFLKLPTLSESVEHLNAADYLQAPELVQFYAKIVVRQSISQEALQQLHEDPSQHPLISNGNNYLKDTIHSYMPELWRTRLVMNYSNLVLSGSFSPDDQHVLTICTDRVVRVFNAKTGKINKVQRCGGRVQGALFSPDGQFLIIALSNVGYVIDRSTKKTVCEFPYPDNHIFSIACSPDSKSVATVLSGKVCVADIATPEIVKTFNFASFMIQCVSYMPDGKSIIVATDGRVYVTNIETGNRVEKFRDNHGIDSVYCSGDGKRLIIAVGQAVCIVDIETGNIIKRFQYDRRAYHASFSSDAKRALISFGNTVRLIDIETGKVIHDIQHGDFVRKGAISHNDKMIITGSDDKTARITERVGNTFDAALLVHYMEWCIKHKKSMSSSRWATNVYNACEDKKVFNRLMGVSYGYSESNEFVDHTNNYEPNVAPTNNESSNNSSCVIQ